MNLFRDVIYPLLGLSLLTAGAAMIYRPAGLLVAGALLLLLANSRPNPKS